MGIPAPGETILLLAAATAASGTSNIIWVILSAAIGAIVGDNIAFYLGRRHGGAILARVAHLDEAKLSRSQAFFDRHGAKTVFVARFIPLLRMVSAYLAGINQMQTTTFMFYNMLGGVVWAVTIGTVGYIFGRNIHVVEQALRRIGGLVAILLVVGLILYWLNRRWQQSERSFHLGRIGILSTWLQRLWRLSVQRGLYSIFLYLLILVVSVWATGFFVEGVAEQSPELAQLDLILVPWLKSGLNEVPVGIEIFALLGDMRILAVISLVAALWQWSRSRQLAGITLLNFIGALALGTSIQLWLKRPLPPSPEPLWQLFPFAFPYLPALLTVVVCGWLAYLVSNHRSWSARTNAGTIAAFLSISIGLIGLYLLQARLSDVLMGLTLGILWLGVPIALAQAKVSEAR